MGEFVHEVVCLVPGDLARLSSVDARDRVSNNEQPPVDEGASRPARRVATH
jgi:hypothetical protein